MPDSLFWANIRLEERQFPDLLVWWLIADRQLRADTFLGSFHTRTVADEDRAAAAADRVPVFFVDDRDRRPLASVPRQLFIDSEWWTAHGDPRMSFQQFRESSCTFVESTGVRLGLLVKPE